MADETTRSIIPGKVTIIIPLYNQEAYIRQCVESALAQTYKNFEIVIVNDGSTDASRRVVQEVIDDWMRPDSLKRDACEKEIEARGLEYADRRQKIWDKYFPDGFRKISDEAIGYSHTEGLLWAEYVREVNEQDINDEKKWGLWKQYFPEGERVAPTVIDQLNAGLSESRNRAIRVGDGEFILPLDADDYIEPTMLEKTVPKMVDPQVGVVSTDMQYFGLLKNRIPPKGLTLQQEMQSNDLPVCSLIRRAAFEQTRGYETLFVDVGGSTKVLGFEDWEMWISILKRGWKVATVPEPLFNYRVRPNSMIAQAASKRAGLTRLIHLLHPDLWSEKA